MIVRVDQRDVTALTAEDLQQFESILVQWSQLRTSTIKNASTAAELDASTYSVVMTEGANITVDAFIPQNSSVQPVLDQMPQTSSEHLCSGTLECSVSTSLASDGFALYEEQLVRYAIAVGMHRSHDVLATSPSLSRRLDDASAQSPWLLVETLSASTMTVYANFTLEEVTMTELSAQVQWSHLTPGEQYTPDSAQNMLDLMEDVSDLVGNLSTLAFINAADLAVEPQVVYTDINGTRIVLHHAPPPPSIPLIIAEEPGSGDFPPPVTGNAFAPSVEEVGQVADVVSAAVAAAVAGAVAAAVGSAVAGAVGGAVGGAAGGGGAASASAAFPLVFGAQRMSVSGGIAVNKSDFQTGVADGLGWATGKFGLAGGGAGRRLAQKSHGGVEEGEENECEEGCAEMLDTLITAGFAACAIVFMRLVVLYLWTRRINARYYEEQMEDPKEVKAEVEDVDDAKKTLERRRRKRATFSPLPGTFVFPNLEFLTMGVFSVGLAESAVSVLAQGEENCGSTCWWTALIIMICIGLFALTGFLMLLRFYLIFSAQCWVHREEVKLAKDIEDPSFRWLSLTRKRLGLPPIPRDVGSFEVPEEDGIEPMRTHRLLASPLTLLHNRAGDVVDSLSLFWMMRSTGGSIAQMFYDFVCFIAMLGIAVLCGLGDFIGEHGGPAASLAQAVVIFLLQGGLVVFIVIVRPSIDRMERLQNMLQVGFEAAATGLLLMPLIFPGLIDSSALTAFGGFLAAMVAVLLPALFKLWDSLITPLIVCMFDSESIGTKIKRCFGLLMALPTMFCGDAADIVDSVSEHVGAAGRSVSRRVSSVVGSTAAAKTVYRTSSAAGTTLKRSATSASLSLKQTCSAVSLPTRSTSARAQPHPGARAKVGQVDSESDKSKRAPCFGRLASRRVPKAHHPGPRAVASIYDVDVSSDLQQIDKMSRRAEKRWDSRVATSGDESPGASSSRAEASKSSVPVTATDLRSQLALAAAEDSAVRRRRTGAAAIAHAEGRSVAQVVREQSRKRSTLSSAPAQPAQPAQPARASTPISSTTSSEVPPPAAAAARGHGVHKAGAEASTARVRPHPPRDTVGTAGAPQAAPAAAPKAAKPKKKKKIEAFVVISPHDNRPYLVSSMETDPDREVRRPSRRDDNRPYSMSSVEPDPDKEVRRSRRRDDSRPHSMSSMEPEPDEDVRRPRRRDSNRHSMSSMEPEPDEEVRRPRRREQGSQGEVENVFDI